jgi:hypothetical protein
MIADNRLAEKAGWDKEILEIELQGLVIMGFEVEVTGFEVPEVDLAERTTDCPRKHKNEVEINIEINIAIRPVPVALRSIRRGRDAIAVAECPSAQRSARCDFTR